MEQELLLELKTPEEKLISIYNSDRKGPDARLFEEGDEIFVSKMTLPGSEPIYTIHDFDRRTPLLILFGIFFIAVLFVSGKQGLEALLGMAFSFTVLIRFVLPLLTLGVSPMLATLAGSALIIPSTFYLSHGVNRKTHIAIGGTLLTLVLTGLLAEIFIPLTKLSGLADESAFYLKAGTDATLNFKSLLLAGVLISILGILDDITISQASIAEELRAAKPNIGAKELYFRCMNIGRDHIASMVNTLILVYAGSNLTFLLLFLSSKQSFDQILNIELLAQEIVFTLIGSIGLICAVPLTSFLACLNPKIK
jgi:uncharacterized membrane protein